MALKGSVNTGSASGSGYNGYLIFTWSANQNIVDNKSNITWSVTYKGGDGVTIHNVNVYINGNRVGGKGQDSITYYNSGNTVCSGSTAIQHSSDGTASFSFSMNGGIVEWNPNVSAQTTFTLDQIKRASSIECDQLTMGSKGTIKITKSDSNYTHTLTYTIGAQSGTIATKTSSASCEWTPSKALATELPNTSIGYVNITCETFSGATSLGSKTITVSINVPSDVIPSITEATLKPSSTNTIVNGWNIAVQGYSKVNIEASANTYPNTGSSITGFVITKGYSATTTGASLNYTNGAELTSSGTVKFGIQAKDARGRLSLVTEKSITVYSYSKPVITNFNVVRDTTTPTNVKISYTSTYSSCNSNNSIKSVKCYYRVKGATTWSQTSSFTAESTNDKTVSEINAESTYEFKLTITDELQTAEQIIEVSTMKVLLDFKAGGAGLGIGKVAEQDRLEVGMASYFGEDVIFNKNINGFNLNKQMPRLTQTGATTISEGADLNSLDYLKVGVYLCNTTNKAKDLKNCPAKIAFNMEVSAPTQVAYDNEENNTGNLYRIQKITTLYANQYTRNIKISGNDYTYGAWHTIATTQDIIDYVDNEVYNYLYTQGTTEINTTDANGKKPWTWTWRKWEQGIAECFLTNTYNPSDYAFSDSGWFGSTCQITGYISMPQYPFTFKYPPNVSVTISRANKDGWGDYIILQHAANDESTIEADDVLNYPPRIKLIRGVRDNKTFVQPQLNIYAIGYWQ